MEILTKRLPLWIALLLALGMIAVTFFFELEDDQATMIGTAGGAFIAVLLGAELANMSANREGRAITGYCATTVRDFADALAALSDQLEALDPEKRIPDDVASRIDNTREALQQAYGVAWGRIRRLQQSFFKMPGEAIGSINLLEDVLSTVDRDVTKKIAWVPPEFLDQVGFAPLDSRIAKVARGQVRELWRIVTWLDGVAKG